MSGLEHFSVRGLRRFQNILFIIGFILLPMVFFMESLSGKYVLSLTFFALFWGFRKAEKMIGKKLQLRKTTKVRDIHSLRATCEDMIEDLKDIFKAKGYSIERNENELLDALIWKLSNCTTIDDYLLLKEEIQKRTLYVLDMKNNKREQTYQKKESHKTNEKIFVSPIAHSLHVLELPEETKDMVIIKKAYKKLIKRYHPDINPSVEAGIKTVELNLAYEQLKNQIEAS